jgi:hypothetical protein
MDTLFWTNLNQKVSVDTTKRPYFGEYFTRVKYYCPGGAYLRDQTNTIDRDDVLQFIENRKRMQRNYRNIGSWAPVRFDIDEISTGQLIDLSIVMSTVDFSVKLRIEEPYLALYTTNEDDLKTLVTRIGHYHRLREVDTPASVESLNNLRSFNAIYRKRDIGFTYKIIVRDRPVYDLTSISFLNYLNNLESLVKVSKTVRKTPKSGTFRQIWFYSNDITFLPMLEIICPGCILKTQHIILE